MTRFDTINAMSRLIFEIGDDFMEDAATLAYGEHIGFPPGRPFYVRGRLGVLGEAPLAVVHAAQGFLGPGLIDAAWEQGKPIMPALEAASQYAAACRAWGQRHLQGVDGLDRFVTLAARILTAAEIAGLPLFAGWKALPIPRGDAAGAAMQMLHVLREYRGAVHLIATQAAGLTPKGAMVANLGVETALRYGWSAPFPDPKALHDCWQEAEQLTTQMVEPAFSVLDDQNQAECLRLLQAMRVASQPA